MSRRSLALVLGTAALIGIGGSGAFAGALSTVASGKLGAGRVDAPASCTEGLTVRPSDSRFDVEDHRYEYAAADVDGDLSGCIDVIAKVLVIDVNNKSVLASNFHGHRITAEDIANGHFQTPLDRGIFSGLSESATQWGVVVQGK